MHHAVTLVWIVKPKRSLQLPAEPESGPVGAFSGFCGESLRFVCVTCVCVRACVRVCLGSLGEVVFDEDSLHADKCFTGQGQTGKELQDSGRPQTHLSAFGCVSGGILECRQLCFGSR